MSEGSLPKIEPKALQAEQARLARFFETINKHRKALDLAIAEEFGGRLDAVVLTGVLECRYPKKKH